MRQFLALSTLSLYILCASSLAWAANVNNVTAKQVNDMVVFEYDLVGSEDYAIVTISINVKDDLSLSGDLGQVSLGRGKRIIWDVLEDFPDGLEGYVKWKINAEGIEPPKVETKVETQAEPSKEKPYSLQKKKRHVPLPGI